MDIGAVLKIKNLISTFKNNHPRVVAFLGDAGASIDEGSIVEVTITTSSGKRMTSNMKILPSDLELLSAVHSVIKQ